MIKKPDGNIEKEKFGHRKPTQGVSGSSEGPRQTTGPKCREIFMGERNLIQLCQTPGITFEQLKTWMENR
ncbi:MAG: hypothetical protein CMI18_04585 [Opitutaceae bacterium]|nr:hypothetical protein [Opitutaceae bacterium]